MPTKLDQLTKNIFDALDILHTETDLAKAKKLISSFIINLLSSVDVENVDERKIHVVDDHWIEVYDSAEAWNQSGKQWRSKINALKEELKKG